MYLTSGGEDGESQQSVKLFPSGLVGSNPTHLTNLVYFDVSGIARFNMPLLPGEALVRPAVNPQVGSRWDESSILSFSTKHLPIRRKSAKRDFRRAVDYSSVESIRGKDWGVRSRPVLQSPDLITGLGLGILDVFGQIGW